MAKVKVLGGDFSSAGFHFGALAVVPKRDAFASPRAYKLLTECSELERLGSGSKTDIGSAVTLGAAGAIVAGPIGLLAGALLAGKKERIAFVAVFNDETRLVGECDLATWAAMVAAKR